MTSRLSCSRSAGGSLSAPLFESSSTPNEKLTRCYALVVSAPPPIFAGYVVPPSSPTAISIRFGRRASTDSSTPLVVRASIVALGLVFTRSRVELHITSLALNLILLG